MDQVKIYNNEELSQMSDELIAQKYKERSTQETLNTSNFKKMLTAFFKKKSNILLVAFLGFFVTATILSVDCILGRVSKMHPLAYVLQETFAGMLSIGVFWGLTCFFYYKFVSERIGKYSPTVRIVVDIAFPLLLAYNYVGIIRNVPKQSGSVDMKHYIVTLVVALAINVAIAFAWRYFKMYKGK